MICQKDKFGRIVPLLLAQTLGAFNDNAVKAFLPVLAAFYFGKESMDQINPVGIPAFDSTLHFICSISRMGFGPVFQEASDWSQSFFSALGNWQSFF